MILTIIAQILQIRHCKLTCFYSAILIQDTYLQKHIYKNLFFDAIEKDFPYY